MVVPSEDPQRVGADLRTAMSGVGARHTPSASTAARYDELFAVYREIYPRTAPLHQALQRASEDQPTEGRA